MWQDLPPDLQEFAKLDNSTGLPGYGSNLTIPSSWSVVLDTDTAELWHLELQGALTFSEDEATSLTTHSLAMPLGSMTAGNSTHPHPAPVHNLTLHFLCTCCLHGFVAIQLFRFSSTFTVHQHTISVPLYC